MRSLILATLAAAMLVPAAGIVAPASAQAHDWRDGRHWRGAGYGHNRRWREARRDYYWHRGAAYRHRPYHHRGYNAPHRDYYGHRGW